MIEREDASLTADELRSLPLNTDQERLARMVSRLDAYETLREF